MIERFLFNGINGNAAAFSVRVERDPLFRPDPHVTETALPRLHPAAPRAELALETSAFSLVPPFAHVHLMLTLRLHPLLTHLDDRKPEHLVGFGRRYVSLAQNRAQLLFGRVNAFDPGRRVAARTAT